MGSKRLGDQELALLRYVTVTGSATAGEIFGAYGEPNHLARSTVETVLERLRAKGFLARTGAKGAYRYEATTVQQELMGGIVEQFVERTLGGSLTPLVTYFSRRDGLTESEIVELERLIRKLENQE